MGNIADKRVRTLVSQREFKHLINDSAASDALAQPAMTTVIPTTGCIDTELAPFIRLMFGGADTANETYTYQVIAWREVAVSNKASVWVGEIVASGTATLGAFAMATSLKAASGLMADTLTDDVNLTGRVLHSPTGDGLASLLLPTAGATLIQVQTRLGTGSKADVFVQLCEN